MQALTATEGTISIRHTIPLKGSFTRRAMPLHRMGHLHTSASVSRIPQLNRLLPPHMIMTMTGAHYRMGNLMGSHLQDPLQPLGKYIHGYVNLLLSVITPSKGGLDGTEFERPPRKVLGNHFPLNEAGSSPLECDMCIRHECNLHYRRTGIKYPIVTVV